jgi:hypothetical protein
VASLAPGTPCPSLTPAQVPLPSQQVARRSLQLAAPAARPAAAQPLARPLLAPQVRAGCLHPQLLLLRQLRRLGAGRQEPPACSR